MTDQSDGDLPLHDEAKARSKWRGGETRIEGAGDTGPASEADDGGRGDKRARREGDLFGDLAQRPPD